MIKIVKKGWGQELWLHNEPDYCFKILEFSGAISFSMHYHMKKTETWYVISGEFILQIIDTQVADRKKITLKTGDSYHVPAGLPHRLTCVSAQGGKIAEASTQHFDDDSYRLEPGASQCSIPQENTTITTDG